MIKNTRNNSGNAGVIVLVIVVLAAFVGFYYWKTRMAAQQAEAEQVAAIRPVAAPRAADTSPHYPVTEQPSAQASGDFKSIGSAAQPGTAGQASTALPQLDESDQSIQGALSAQFAQTKLAKLINMDGLIRRFVISVDNSLRSHAPPAESALFIPSAGKFLTSGKGDSLAIDAANAARYKPFMDMVAEADPKQLVAAYKRFYPLFQAAYKDLNPSGYFNDRLVEALDSMIATPD